MKLGRKPSLSVDGAMGPNYFFRSWSWAFAMMGEYFLASLIAERRSFYRVIVANNPSQEIFYKGWMNRVNEFIDEISDNSIKKLLQGSEKELIV